MANIIIKNAVPRRRSRLWQQVFVGLILMFVLLLLTAYFVVSSNSFFQYFIVPKLSSALNAELKVAHSDVRPFSGVELRDISLTPKGREQLLGARNLRVRLQFSALLRGKIVLEEILVDRPEITVVTRVDGSSNLDPLLQPRSPSVGASASPAFEIKSLKLSNASLRHVSQLPGGGQIISELSQVAIAVQGLKPGSNSRLEIAAELAMSRSASGQAVPDSLHGKISGDFLFSLTPDLQPASVKGNLDFKIKDAAGAMANLNDLGVKLRAESTPTEIKSLALSFLRLTNSLGELRLSGPLDLGKREAKLHFEVASVDAQVLNLIAVTPGLEFNSAAINGTADLELTKAGTLLSFIGNLTVPQLRATRAGLTTPPLDVNCDYSLAVDRSTRSALLGALNIVGTQAKRPLLRAGLTGPMTFAWADRSEATSDATLLVSLSDLNLAEWKPLLGDDIAGGVAKGEIKISSQQTGRVLGYSLKLSAENLALNVGGREIAALNPSLEIAGEARDLQQFKLTEINGQLAQRTQPLLSLQGNAACDLSHGAVESDLTVISSLSDLLPALALPHTDATAGALEVRLRFLQQTNTQTISGRLRLAGFSGIARGIAFLNYSTDADFELARDRQHTQLKRFSARLHEGSKLGGKVAITGNYDAYTTAADVTVKISDFNQYGLRPFLETAFGNRRLTAAALNSSITATRDAKGDATIKAELQLTNLTTVDLKTAIATSPLDVRGQFEGDLVKRIAQVRKGQLQFTPTSRSKNVLSLTAKVDLTRPEAIGGSVKISAPDLDFTKYFDLFAPKPPTPGTRPALAPQAALAVEPAARQLPFHGLVGELNIGRFYARELDASELQIVASFDNNHVYVRPCKVSINGSPVTASADLDLGVPGYQYEFKFDAKEVPLPPLVNTFQPERRGQVGGQATLTMQFTGAGVTGTNLQRNLTGNLDLACSGLNLALGQIRSPLLGTMVNAIVGIPDLVRNPGATLENLVSRFSTFGAPRGGWADDLMSAPLQALQVKVTAGNGGAIAECRGAQQRLQGPGDRRD
jgi:hypothetical protein